jgi:hypothetical protein
MVKFPENLIFIRDQIIDHVQINSPVPEGLDQLVKWIETEHLYDSLMGTWDDERVAMHLGRLSEYRFCDSELIAYSDIVEPITDQARVSYARELISKAFHELDGYDCPSIHTIQIVKDDQTSATLGWTVAIHGQAGPVPTFYGAFSSRNNFYQDLRDSDYLLNGEEESLTDEVILSHWFKLK